MRKFIFKEQYSKWDLVVMGAMLGFLGVNDWISAGVTLLVGAGVSAIGRLK